jgi:dimethylsulfoniopropionate demethylase|tara:strand:- start:3848 stop:4999 length:1152 start_codon:yes stop_codon:yes gene_type:complete
MSAPVLSSSTRVRRTPFSQRIEALGVSCYTIYNHMLLPAVFRSLEEDYAHLCRAVQLWDVSCERQVEIKGPDAARLTQLMTCRDLSKARQGRCFYAPLVDERGGLVNDPIILKLADDRFWLSIADSDVLLWAKGLAYGLGLAVEVFEPDVSPLAVQGPKADDLMARVFGEAVRELKFFGFAWFDFDGHRLLVARSGWSKQGGFEIYLDDSSRGAALWDRLWDAGQDLDVGPGCPNLIERIEGGLFSYGGDMDLSHTPFDAGLADYVDLDAPIDFIGRDALEKVRRDGPRWQMRGLVFEGDCPAMTAHWPLWSEQGAAIGRASAACWSPRFDCALGFAMVAREFADDGQVVELETPAGTRNAVVRNLPFDADRLLGKPRRPHDD